MNNNIISVADIYDPLGRTWSFPCFSTGQVPRLPDVGLFTYIGHLRLYTNHWNTMFDLYRRLDDGLIVCWWRAMTFKDWLVPLLPFFVSFLAGYRNLDLVPQWLLAGVVIYLFCLIHDTVRVPSHGITFFGLRRRLDDGLMGVVWLTVLSICASALWCLWLPQFTKFKVHYLRAVSICHTSPTDAYMMISKDFPVYLDEFACGGSSSDVQ